MATLVLSAAGAALGADGFNHAGIDINRADLAARHLRHIDAPVRTGAQAIGAAEHGFGAVRINPEHTVQRGLHLAAVGLAGICNSAHLRLYSIASSRHGDDGKGMTISLCVRRCFYVDEVSGERFRVLVGNPGLVHQEGVAHPGQTNERGLHFQHWS